MGATYEPQLESMNPDPIAAFPKDSDDKDEDDTFVIHTNLLIPGEVTQPKTASCDKRLQDSLRRELCRFSQET